MITQYQNGILNLEGNGTGVALLSAHSMIHLAHILGGQRTEVPIEGILRCLNYRDIGTTATARYRLQLSPI